VADTFKDYRAQLVDTNAHLYTGSQGSSAYTRDEGLLVIPVMGPAGTAPSVVRVHAPYGVRRSRFAASKLYQPPLFPPAADTTSGDTILHSEITFPTPALGPEGALEFSVAGEYVYVQPDGGRDTESTFPINRHPFPTTINVLNRLRKPAADDGLDMTWHWNCDYIDARLLCSYDLFG
jgi:hypothetical protein